MHGLRAHDLPPQLPADEVTRQHEEQIDPDEAAPHEREAREAIVGTGLADVLHGRVPEDDEEHGEAAQSVERGELTGRSLP